MMVSILNRNTKGCFPVALLNLAAIGLLLFFLSPVYAGDMCEETKKQLRGSLNTLHNNGGLWGFMEQSGSELREKSTLGFHLDNKFTRAVVTFEEMCGNGSGKEIEATLFKQVQEEIARGKAIKRRGSGKNTAEILGELEQLKKDLDNIIKKYEH